MLTRTLSIAALLLAVFAATPARALNVGDKAPEIKVDDWFNTQPLTLAGLNNNIVVVEFWATWCPPCRASIPHLVKMHEEFKDKGVVFIGLTDEPKNKIEKFVTDMKMTYAVGAGSPSGDRYGVNGIPHAFIVAPGGQVVWHGHPMSGLDKAVENALRTTPPVLVDPADKARGEKLLAEARDLAAGSDPARAAAKLNEIAGIKGSFEAKDQAAAKLLELSAQGAKELEAAAAKPPLEAHAAVKELAARWAGTKAGDDAKAKLAELEGNSEVKQALLKNKFDEEAKVLMAGAEAAAQRSEWAKALPLYEKIAREYPMTQTGKEAAKKAEALKADKALMAKLGANEETKKADGMLRMAKSFIKNNAREMAREKLEALIKEFPESAAAGEAKELLKSL
ncbi:MAG: redoxin domain-containing protein [Planctomycetota bacterium]|nr:redoxin domain-containing protein [Planctomycetota bacterium]